MDIGANRRSARRLQLDLAGDRPDEADHLASDRGGDHHLGLAGGDQMPIARAEPGLRLPGNVADVVRQRLEEVVKLAADPYRHAIGPGPLDQHPSDKRVARLGNAAAANRAAARPLARYQAEIGHELT